MNSDELYMARCLQLAKNGELGAAPNPMVGAVIVCDGKIIGEGFHAHCGGPHAEVNAFNSVRDGSLLSKSTLYVSLEPCAHYGRTPPCAQLVVDKGVRRVVVGCIDPFAKVRGRGVRLIHDAGIDIQLGVLNSQCKELNRRFFTFHTCRRPYITLKWAQTSDGIIGFRANTNGQSRRLMISSLPAMRRAHHLRARHSAILVGYNTALWDNPSLTTRLVDGPDPLRIVIDPQGRLPQTLSLFDGSVPTLVFGYRRSHSVAGRTGVEFVKVDKDGDFIRQLLDELYNRNIQSVLVEGGGAVLQHFLTQGLWDEAHVEHASWSLDSMYGRVSRGSMVRAPIIESEPYSCERLGSSVIKHYFRGRMG